MPFGLEMGSGGPASDGSLHALRNEIRENKRKARLREQASAERESPYMIAPTPPGNTWIQVRVVSENDNTLVCEHFNGTMGMGEIIVAKPFELRRTTYDGETYGGATYTYVDPSNRTADGTNQTVIPPYRDEKSVIYAVQIVCGGTGIDDVTFIDMNTDGRAWADDDT